MTSGIKICPLDQVKKKILKFNVTKTKHPGNAANALRRRLQDLAGGGGVL